MAEDKPRLSRLTAIITQLQSSTLVTAAAIAEKHQVSVRTVFRDIKTLKDSGIPIITVEGKGYSMMEGYKLPPVMFSEEEANALITAEQFMLRNKDQSLINAYQSAVLKIKSVLRQNQKEQSEFLASRIQIRSNWKNQKTSNYLIQLQAAIVNFKRIKLDYKSLQQVKSQRIVEPFALYTTKENWILIAYCLLRKDFRAFRLDAIQQLSIQDEHFEPHDMTLEQYLESCRNKWKGTPDIPLSQADATFALNQKYKTMQHVKIEPFKFMGIYVRTTNENGQAINDIAELWNQFLSKNVLDKIPNKVDSTIYSLYTDYIADHTQPYTAIIGCKVTDLNEIPEGMIGKSFRGGDYVKTTAKGNLKEGLIGQHWSKIFEMGLDRAFTADFEEFGAKAQPPENAEVDFYVAVK